jgi:hypothetical protein
VSSLSFPDEVYGQRPDDVMIPGSKQFDNTDSLRLGSGIGVTWTR